ncbi:hypothetical protein PG997_013638 [Apiospora hydei]|uniref:Uncharacterized protein n=1 Tax=Apiospora hydei TaxID=1337664 RepID=A0ABR1V9B5_9PEZI
MVAQVKRSLIVTLPVSGKRLRQLGNDNDDDPPNPPPKRRRESTKRRVADSSDEDGDSGGSDKVGGRSASQSGHAVHNNNIGSDGDVHANADGERDVSLAAGIAVRDFATCDEATAQNDDGHQGSTRDDSARTSAR